MTPLQQKLNDLFKKLKKQKPKPKRKKDFTDDDFILDELESIEEEGY